MSELKTDDDRPATDRSANPPTGRPKPPPVLLNGDTKKLRAICKHEASHAVIGHHCGLHITRVYVERHDHRDAGCLTVDFTGACEWGNKPVPYTDDYFRARVVTALAGPAQDGMTTGQGVSAKNRKDRTDARFCAGMCFVDEDDEAAMTAYLDQAMTEALDLCWQHRHEIAALAARLAVETVIEYPFGHPAG